MNRAILKLSIAACRTGLVLIAGYLAGCAAETKYREKAADLPPTVATPSSPFASAPTGAIELQSNRRVSRVVFVVDASGSTIGAMPLMLNEFKRILVDVQEDQSFALLFSTGRGVVKPPQFADGCIAATPAHKRAVLAWIDTPGNVAPSGAWDANNVIDHALRLGAQVIVVISDDSLRNGPNEIDRRQLARTLTAATDRGVRINACQLIHSRPAAESTQSEAVVWMTERTGGRYRAIELAQP